MAHPCSECPKPLSMQLRLATALHVAASFLLTANAHKTGRDPPGSLSAICEDIHTHTHTQTQTTNTLSLKIAGETMMHKSNRRWADITDDDGEAGTGAPTHLRSTLNNELRTSAGTSRRSGSTTSQRSAV